MVEPISVNSSARSPPTKCRLPVGGKEGSGYLKLGLMRCHFSCWARESLGQVFECPWYTERHCARAGVPGDASVPSPREPRLLALVPLMPSSWP